MCLVSFVVCSIPLECRVYFSYELCVCVIVCVCVCVYVCVCVCVCVCLERDARQVEMYPCYRLQNTGARAHTHVKSKKEETYVIVCV